MLSKACREPTTQDVVQAAKTLSKCGQFFPTASARLSRTTCICQSLRQRIISEEINGKVILPEYVISWDV